MTTLETDRLTLRQLAAGDEEFVMRLVNEPSWLRYIGDKGVRTLADAKRYIDDGPVAMYARHGFGMLLVALKDSPTPIGICGLIKRETLEDVDLGFAFLPEFWGRGYAMESASAVLRDAWATVGLSRVVAITSRDNSSSSRVLRKLGFRFERLVRLEGDPEELELYEIEQA